MSFNLIDVAKLEQERKAEKALRADYDGEVSSEVLDSLCREFRGWMSSGDPDYLDAAVSLLSANKVPIKGGLLDEVGKLANDRLSGEVKKSTGKRKEFLNNLKELEPYKTLLNKLGTKSGSNKVFATEPAIANVFELVEICGFYELPAFFYAACINEKMKGARFFKSIKAGRLRQLYRKYKKTDDYQLLVSDLEQYKEIKYPDMTDEEIEHSITKGEVFCKQTYSYLLEQGKEFKRIKRKLG